MALEILPSSNSLTKVVHIGNKKKNHIFCTVKTFFRWRRLRFNLRQRKKGHFLSHNDEYGYNFYSRNINISDFVPSARAQANEEAKGKNATSQYHVFNASML